MTRNNTYTVYEPNLLLEDGRRQNVLSHESYYDIKRDAQTINMHLGVDPIEKGK